MDKSALRHVMASIIVSEELRVPTNRTGDPDLSDDRMRKQFTPMLENAYCIVDLMVEIGERRFAERMASSVDNSIVSSVDNSMASNNVERSNNVDNRTNNVDLGPLI